MTMLQDVSERPVGDLSTRARIRDAAMDEFAAKGYRGATMRGIASAAGVSLGLVQHHFGTKEGLRTACDEMVLDLVRFKTEAVADGTISDHEVLASLMSMAPRVQRYLGRALVDGSSRISTMVDGVMAKSEDFLSSRWPERYPSGAARTRDAAAVMTAVNTSTIVLQAHLARRMKVEPWSIESLQRIGTAMFDVFEAIASMVDSDMWRDLRAAVATLPNDQKEQG